MWETSLTPKDWQQAITKLLHKKGPTTDMANYRPITLLTTLFKIWERLLNTRLTAILEMTDAISPLQSGSRSKYSAPWTILARSVLIKNARNKGKDIYVLNIDLNKAYNRVNREKLWTIMWHKGIRGRLLKAISGTYSHCTETIMIGGKHSDVLELTKGLRQGSVLSPTLVTIYVNPLIDGLTQSNTGLATDLSPPLPQKIPVLMYVDDLQTFGTSITEIITQLELIMEYSDSHESIINYKKSGILSTLTPKALKDTVDFHKIPLNPENKAEHLGSMFTLQKRKGQEMGLDVKHRMGKAHAITSQLKSLGFCLTKRSDLNLTSKLLSSLTIPSLVHGISSITASRRSIEWMDKALIPQLEATMGIKITPQTLKWAYREMDMIPPSDQVRINDVALFCRAVNQTINSLYAAIFKKSPELISATKDMLNCSDLKEEDLVGKSPKAVMKALKEATFTMLYEEAKPKPPADYICNPGPGPVTNVTNIQADITRNYIQIRDFVVKGQPGTVTCFLCPSDEKHDLVHCISRCTYFPIKDLREKIKIELEQHTENLSTVVDELTHTSLLDILEAEGYEEKTLQLLSEAFTRIVMKSPILGKVIGHHGV